MTFEIRWSVTRHEIQKRPAAPIAKTAIRRFPPRSIDDSISRVGKVAASHLRASKQLGAPGVRESLAPDRRRE